MFGGLDTNSKVSIGLVVAIVSGMVYAASDRAQILEKLSQTAASVAENRSLAKSNLDSINKINLAIGRMVSLVEDNQKQIDEHKARHAHQGAELTLQEIQFRISALERAVKQKDRE